MLMMIYIYLLCVSIPVSYTHLDVYKRQRVQYACSWKWDVLDHPPYSPDLAPSDFHLFLHLKQYLAGKKFDDDDEVKEEVMTW